jgi:hypothetical protein
MLSEAFGEMEAVEDMDQGVQMPRSVAARARKAMGPDIVT